MVALFIVRPWLLKLGESTSKSESIPQSESGDAGVDGGVGGAGGGRAGVYRGGAIHREGRRVSNNARAGRPARPTKLI